MQSSLIQGYQFSKICLGTVALGMEYGISNTGGKPALSESSAILSAALHAGINCFDTAPGYGDAEQLLGNFFKDHPAPIHLITKCTAQSAHLRDHDLLRNEMETSVRRSLKTLGLDSIPVCLFINK